MMSPQLPHQPTPEEIEAMLAKASQPAKDAVWLHEYFGGKMSTLPKCPVEQM